MVARTAAVGAELPIAMRAQFRPFTAAPRIDWIGGRRQSVRIVVSLDDVERIVI
jgi:hypothetical protein